MPLPTRQENTEVELSQKPTADTIMEQFQASRNDFILKAGRIRDGALRSQDYKEVDKSLDIVRDLNKEYQQLHLDWIENLNPFRPLPQNYILLIPGSSHFFVDFVMPLHRRYQELLDKKINNSMANRLLKWLSSPAPAVPGEISTITSTQKTVSPTEVVNKI